MLLVLDGAALRLWCVAGRRALAAARQEIDDLNVFPVPDGDTGTNLLLTMESAERAVRLAAPGADPALGAVAQALASGALMGARGNSGVLLASLLRGLADGLAPAAAPDAPAAGPRELAAGLRRGAELARAAVAHPVEGTLLTVAATAATAATAAAAAAVAAGRPDGLHAVAVAARDGACLALERTPDLLPALRDAGVVDAGGRGLCVLLAVLVAVVAGDVTVVAGDGARVAGGVAGDAVAARDIADQAGREPAAAPVGVLSTASASGPRQAGAHPAAPEPLAKTPGGGSTYAYEVQYLLQGTSVPALDELRVRLAGLGDSVAVVGGPELANVHVHVDDVGAAIEAGVEVGRPSRITVTRFDEPPVRADRPASGRAVVALATGSGVAQLFRAGGAVVVEAGPGRRAAMGEVLRAVLATGVRSVAVLPNDPDCHAVVAAAGREAERHGVRLAVVPTDSPVQGLAALAVTDPHRPFEADVVAMSAAAAATRWGHVALAVRAATTQAGPCLPGQALGVVAGRTVLVGALPEDVGGLLDRLLAGAEMLTAVLGRDAPPGLEELVRTGLAQRYPAVRAVVVRGDQPLAVLLLGAE